MSSLLPSLWGDEPNDQDATLHDQLFWDGSTANDVFTSDEHAIFSPDRDLGAPTADELNRVECASPSGGHPYSIYVSSVPPPSVECLPSAAPTAFLAPSFPLVPSLCEIPSLLAPSTGTPSPSPPPFACRNPPLSPSFPRQAAPKRQRCGNQYPELFTSAITRENLLVSSTFEGPPERFDKFCVDFPERPIPYKYEQLPAAMRLEPIVEPRTECSGTMIDLGVPDAEEAHISRMGEAYNASPNCLRLGDVHTTCSKQVAENCARRVMNTTVSHCTAESREFMSDTCEAATRSGSEVHPIRQGDCPIYRR